MGEDITNATKTWDICLGTRDGRQLLKQTQHQSLREHPKAWKIPAAGSPGEGDVWCLLISSDALGCHLTGLQRKAEQ